MSSRKQSSSSSSKFNEEFVAMLKFSAKLEDTLSGDVFTMYTLLRSTNKLVIGLLLSSSSDLPVSGKSPIEARRESGEYILVFAHDDDVVCSCRNATHGSSRTSECRTDSGRAALRRGRRVDDLDAIVAKITLESMVNCIPFNRI